MSEKSGIIILYRIRTKTTKSNTEKFCREFYGYMDKSNYGKYQYRRKGLLDRIPHIKLIRGAIIIQKGNCNKVTQFLKRFNAEVHVRTIILTEKDKKQLTNE